MFKEYYSIRDLLDDMLMEEDKEPEQYARVLLDMVKASPIQMEEIVVTRRVTNRRDLVGTSGQRVHDFMKSHNKYVFTDWVKNSDCKTGADMIKQAIINLYARYVSREYFSEQVNEARYAIHSPYFKFFAKYPFGYGGEIETADVLLLEQRYLIAHTLIKKLEEQERNRKLYSEDMTLDEFIEQVIFPALVTTMKRYKAEEEIKRKNSYEYCSGEENLVVKYIVKSLKCHMKTLYYQSFNISPNRVKDRKMCECGRYFVESRYRGKSTRGRKRVLCDKCKENNAKEYKKRWREGKNE